MKARVEALRAEMKEAGEAVFLVTEGKNRRYLSGFTGSSGWLVITGPKGHARGFIEGITLLASTRLCPNVPAFASVLSVI